MLACAWEEAVRERAYLRQVRDVSPVDAHLLRREKKGGSGWGGGGGGNQDALSLLPFSPHAPKCADLREAHLCDFQELWDSRHSSEEFLVDIQALFTLSFLHVKVFLCEGRIVEISSRIEGYTQCA